MSELSRPLSSFVKIPNDLIQKLIDSMIDLGTRGLIRVTDKEKFSVYDVIEKIAGKTGERTEWKRISDKYPEVVAKCYYFQFPGQGQRLSPVADMATTIEIIWLLPGEFSDKMRRVGAEIVSTVIQQQQVSAPDQSLLMAVVSELAQLKHQIGAVTALASDYMQVRRYSDSNLPGFNTVR